MRADAHAHVFRFGFASDRQAGAEFAQYQELRERYAITETLIIGYEGAPEFKGNSAEILALSEEHPWIRPTVYLDPLSPPSPGVVRDWLARGATGFSLYLGDSAELAQHIPAETWGELSASGALLSINATPRAILGLTPVLQSIDHARVLISHLGLPGSLTGVPVRDQLDRIAPVLALARFPHITVKVSGLYAADPVFPHADVAPTGLALLDSFGASRLAWGSDFSPALGTLSEAELFQLPEWFTTQLSPHELDLVSGGTLLSLLERSRA